MNQIVPEILGRMNQVSDIGWTIRDALLDGQLIASDIVVLEHALARLDQSISRLDEGAEALQS